MTAGSINTRELDAVFPQLAPFERPTRLLGGSLNFVWRVHCATGSVVVKRAPPYVASLPHLPLSSRRLLFEAGALRLFEDGPLKHMVSDAARPPHLLGLDEASSLLVEEDVGPGSDLSDALDDVLALSRLGTFIGDLHRETADSPDLARQFDNADVQRARLETQYAHIAEFAMRAGADDAVTLGDSAVALGRRFLAPGRCLVMGDLWPPSVLPRATGVRIIDWELAHFGSPAQDVGHLLAHLTLCGAIENSAETATAAMSQFLIAYRKALGSQLPVLWDPEVARDTGLHFGAELLARAWGPFRMVALETSPDLRRAVTEHGLMALRHPASVVGSDLRSRGHQNGRA